MTEQTRVFQLERLYVTMTTGGDGQPPALQLMARTPGVKPEHLTECWQMAQLMPPPSDQRTEAMPGSFGIFRGETVDFIIVKAQISATGTPQYQYLLTPSAVLHKMGGNYRLLEAYAKEPIPQFAKERTDLPPFVLDDPEQPTRDSQTDDLLALMDFCKNDLKVVSGLLGGLVEAMGIGVINAPPSLHDRVTFVQGLLAMLPLPARIAITFATSVLDPAQTNTQIKFFARDVRPARHLIFDWATGKLLTDAPEDVYAKYILSQLRLDLSLVLDATEKLARTAVWRAMRKDDMANALAWVSRRASLDSAVEAGMPADRTMVAAVLREDPTLPDDLRISYGRHLLRLSLALDDGTDTEIIPMMAVSHREAGDAAFAQLEEAAESEHALAVYHMVERWLLQPPNGIDASKWQPLLGKSALAQTNHLLTGEAAPLVKFLDQFVKVQPVLQLEPVIAQMIGASRKRAYEDPEIARSVFLLAAKHLPASGMQRLLAETKFVEQLPQALRAAFPHFVTMDKLSSSPPPALLVKASEVFGPDYTHIILARLVEWALYLHRFDMLDVPVLRGMIKAAASPDGLMYDNLIKHLVDSLSQIEVLRRLNIDAPRCLVELHIVCGRFADAIYLLEVFQTTIYKNSKRDDLSEMLRAIFRELPLNPKSLFEALEAMTNSQIKSVARANAYIGALEGRGWGKEVEPAARKLTAILFADPRMTELIGIEPVLRLLKTNADRKDPVEAIRLASALVEYALTLGLDSGPDLMRQVYPLVNWSPEVNEAAVEILRTYVRRAPIELAKDLPKIMGDKYGEFMRRELDASHRMRLIVGGSDIMPFAEQVRVSTQLLMDMALTYGPSREAPQIHQLRRTVESTPGGLTDKERQRLSENLNLIGQQIIRLAQIASNRKVRGDADELRNRILKGQFPPQNGLDALLWLGGHTAEGRFFPLELDREAPAYVFGNRSVNILLRETDMLVSLLDGLLLAFPDYDPLPLDLETWRHEVNTLWGMLTLYKQRQITQIMTEDIQLLAQLLKVIGEKGNERIFQTGGVGKQLQTGKAQPRSVIEALRWVSGYFARAH